MRVFRLAKAEYSASVLSGDGGLLSDGRWHSIGRRVVYTASCEALTILEVRVHWGRALPRTDFAMHMIDLPDDAVIDLANADRPKRWNAIPATATSQQVGDAWLAATRSLALRLPSVHIATDHTILLNPAHPRAPQLRRIDARPYYFDPRLFVR